MTEKPLSKKEQEARLARFAGDASDFEFVGTMPVPPDKAAPSTAVKPKVPSATTVSK